MTEGSAGGSHAARFLPLPPVVFTDIDGVWTDGGMYYAESGEELKRFTTSDSAGVLLLRNSGSRVVIITGEQSQAVARRAVKLGVDGVFLGVRDKLRVAEEYARAHGLRLADAGHVGDDVNDLDLMESVAVSACPSSAPSYVQQRASIVLRSQGGYGAFREFAELLLLKSGMLDQAIMRWRVSLRSEIG